MLARILSSRPRSRIARLSFVTVAALVALSAIPLLAQGTIPREGCPEPRVNDVAYRGDHEPDAEDAGVGASPVLCYGTMTRRLPLPFLRHGLRGLAPGYHGTFLLDMSYSAWGSPGTLVGGSFPVPNLDKGNLENEDAEYVQPRPGNMPGLYLYYDDSSENFYHYGGPLESGANPQSTAEYGSPEEIPGSLKKYFNQLSGAQLWHYNPGDPITTYIEIKHVDGTIARFEAFDPYRPTYNAPGSLWRVDKVTDPYDNVADYSYDNKHRLSKIEFPSGLTQRFDYDPSSGGWGSWSWSGTQSGLQVRYEQTSNGSTTALTDQTWGIVFKDSSGTSQGTHFALRPYRFYSAVRKVQKEQLTAEQPYAASTVDGQVVHEFTYVTDLGGGSNTGLLTETNRVHTGTTFAPSLTTVTDLPDRDILETRFDITTKKVMSQDKPQVGLSIDVTYPSALRTTDLDDLPTGATLSATLVTDALGNEWRFEYHAGTGKLYSTIITPVDDANGKPRDHSGISTPEVEPEKIEIYRIFGSSECTCQKPVEVRTIATRNSTTYTRTVYSEYDSSSRLLTKRTVPNPATTPLPQPSHVDYEYTYIRAKTGSQAWGAWLPDEEITPDGTWEYVYNDWLNRADANQHGRIAGTVTRQMTGVRIQTSLTGNPAATSTISQTLHHNLSNSPGGLSQTGSVNGQPRRIFDGDGVASTFEYTDEGWLGPGHEGHERRARVVVVVDLVARSRCPEAIGHQRAAGEVVVRDRLVVEGYDVDPFGNVLKNADDPAGGGNIEDVRGVSGGGPPPQKLWDALVSYVGKKSIPNWKDVHKALRSKWLDLIKARKVARERVRSIERRQAEIRSEWRKMRARYREAQGGK